MTGRSTDRGPSPPWTRPVLLAIFLLTLTVRVVQPTSEFDPYQVLGVGRSASQAEIKRAYKNLVREWHPDKSRDPKAEDMFIKISKSYQILSNEERRSNFDRYGQMDENQPFGQSQHHGFRSFHSSFYFDESFFHFPRSRDFDDSKYMLHHAQFNSDVLPDSYKRPYLIKVTAEWCLECMYFEPVWKQAVQELEPLGVGIGIVDLGFERRLANQLGAYRAPSIIGLVNGRMTFFHQAVVREHLRHFVEDLLPQNLVQRINDDNCLAFIDGWHAENKPSVLLFDQVPVVPLLYKLTAFAFRDYVRFGFVDQGGTHNAKLLRQFNINTYAPTMLLFKEDTEKPIDIIQARGMKRQLMDEFVSNNKFLQVPRLVSQQLFDELCPVKQFHRRRKYCILLITGEDEAFLPGNKAFLDFASSNKKDVLRFAYVYQRQQQPLCQALLHNHGAVSPQVVILERRSQAGRVLYRSVSGGWNGSEEDKYRLHEQLELLQKDPTYLTSDTTLPELNNEMAPIFIVQWMNAAYDYILQTYDGLLYSNWREMMPILSLIFSALFILFGTVIIQAFSESGESKPRTPKEPPTRQTEEDASSRQSTSSRPPKKDFVEVTELTDITYISNLVKLRPGHINIVLVLTDASKNALLRKFAKEVFSFSGTQTLHFSFLNADKHHHWMPSLLHSASYPGDSDSHSEDEESSDYAGHVLALNGYKKYFCIFRPVFTGDDPSDSSSETSVSSDGKRKSRSRSRTSSHSRSRSHSREDGAVPRRGSGRATSIEVHHKLDRLGLWMERLMEGTLPRLHVPAWPALSENSSSTES
ncbi:dnaJ homolog subfamily C member 16 [Kryptolebias marmoratus]|uniref:DnaJ homolog subfamily C member 16 n=1 Tax=Kryptolebias marmoratus TaxID=37003 RepID=A0A3Q2ZV10_KRYMA|nr:dnaJ homolog subfamily C member 16 [Kryptolebias marmoratus]XP_024865955.1 dnaJ homolog subfamily C member 16 [Kryptolebias marmoratus]